MIPDKLPFMRLGSEPQIDVKELGKTNESTRGEATSLSAGHIYRKLEHIINDFENETKKILTQLNKVTAKIDSKQEKIIKLNTTAEKTSNVAKQHLAKSAILTLANEVQDLTSKKETLQSDLGKHLSSVHKFTSELANTARVNPQLLPKLSVMQKIIRKIQFILTSIAASFSSSTGQNQVKGLDDKLPADQVSTTIVKTVYADMLKTELKEAENQLAMLENELIYQQNQKQQDLDEISDEKNQIKEIRLTFKGEKNIERVKGYVVSKEENIEEASSRIRTIDANIEEFKKEIQSCQENIQKLKDGIN